MSANHSTKTCKVCGKEKPIAEFYKYKNRAGIYRPRGRCKLCLLEQNKQYAQANAATIKEYQRWYQAAKQEQISVRRHAYYEANRDEILRAQREYVRDNRESVREQKKAYYQRHREWFAEYMKTYRLSNRESVRKRGKRHYEENPQLYLAYSRARRARLAEVGGSHDDEDVRAKYLQQRGQCHWCAASLQGVYHVDHVVPISKGGGNGPGNICCACPACNLAKGTKMPWEFSDRLFVKGIE